MLLELDGNVSLFTRFSRFKFLALLCFGAQRIQIAVFNTQHEAEPYKIPASIDNRAILDEITVSLKGLGYAKAS